MTSNQIAYWSLQEQKRSNAAKEYETARNNAAIEAITKKRDANTYILGSHQLNEAVRHNVASEAETSRSNQAREYETGRHNRKTESLQAYSQAEMQRHNRQTEVLAGSQLSEAIRHNTAVETETNRSNLATERETHQNNTKNRRQRSRQFNRQYELDKSKTESDVSVNEAREENLEQDTLLKKAELGAKGSTILRNVVSTLGQIGAGIARTYAATKLAGSGASLILK